MLFTHHTLPRQGAVEHKGWNHRRFVLSSTDSFVLYAIDADDLVVIGGSSQGTAGAIDSVQLYQRNAQAVFFVFACWTVAEGTHCS